MNDGESLQAVVFDLDGLMFNTEELYQEVGGQLLARRGCRLTDDLLDQMMGRRSRVALQIMIDWHDLDDTIEQLQAETTEIFSEILPTRLAPMPGLLALLDALENARLPKAIATSSRREFVTTVLGQFDMAPRFEFVLTAEDVQHGKPDPEVYRLAAARWQLSPARLLVLEDSQNGCRAAVDAGTFAVAVPGLHSHSHDFQGARIVADTLADPRIHAALGLPTESP